MMTRLFVAEAGCATKEPACHIRLLSLVQKDVVIKAYLQMTSSKLRLGSLRVEACFEELWAATNKVYLNRVIVNPFRTISEDRS
jgi:hypothetical protein